MNPKKISSPAYEALVVWLQKADSAIQVGSLFGMPCLKKGGKACVGSYDGGLVVKLSGQTHTDALTLPGAILFDPSGKGRPMKAWVVIPNELSERWPALAMSALSGG